MRKKFVRILCLILSAVLVLGLITGALVTFVSAATVYQLVDLLESGKLKPLGRTQKNADGDGITADWSGSGFDINVSGDGGTLTVGFSASYTAYWAILVDDDQIWRGYTASGTGSFSATIPSGSHTVRVVKETQTSSSETSYSNLTTLTFDGTIETAPANKSLYIEFVGDSITCGDGALGEYEPGVKWLGAHDSATHSFAYYAAQKLNADYSLVARGGIGLFTGISEAEGTAQKKGMQDIYNYVSAYNSTSNGEYSFSRQPQVVFIELGANDSIGTGTYNSIAYWKGLMEDFIDQVRSKNPNAQIVLHSTNATKYKALMEIVAARAESDPKLHTFYYAYLGNGSAALATQYAGHPDYNDLERFGDALANFLKAQDIVPAYTSTSSYTDITYYVSENGNDDNDGKTIDTAKKTLSAVFTQAQEDNSNSYKFAADARIMIYVQGTVLTNSSASQVIGGSQVFMKNGGSIRDHIPIVLTTYDYSGERATIQVNYSPVDNGNASTRVVNDLEFRDITLKSVTNTTTGCASHRLYASGCTLTFDNALLTTDGKASVINGEDNNKWIVAADHFNTSGFNPLKTEWLPYNNTVIFKNGDYTNLNYVTAVLADSILNGTEKVTELPQVNCTVIIEDGAKMSTVIGRVGTMAVESAEVIINGGSVQQYVGTADGTSSARKTYNGDINLTVNGGEIYGTHFSTAGRYATINGDINTTINGGIFEITPQDTASQYDAYFFGGRQNCIVEDINTTITGGQLYLIFDVAGVDSAYYFGVSGSGTAKNVTNKISGGLFMPYARGAVGKEANMFLGTHTGNITGTLRNEISGGNFQFGLAGIADRSIFVGSRGVNWATGKIENIFGAEGSTHGPNLGSVALRLAGGWAQVGVTSKQSVQPTGCSDTVVVSNTIYGGNYSALYFGSTGNPDSSEGYYTFIKGSIENKIYGGFFQSTVYAAGNGPVYGHVKTDIYGGYFKSIYGGTENKATVYDGVELNIYGLEEYYPVSPNDTWVFCAGNASGNVPVPATAGRDAIKFTIAPSKSIDLPLNTKLKVGATEGSTSVSVSGGYFPRGFAIDGKTVGEALASGCVIFDASTGTKATYSSTDTAVTGAVVVDQDADSFVNELVYYVSENGQDAYSGTSIATPKKTLAAVYSQAITDNGGYRFPLGTKVTIYVEGEVVNNAGSSNVLGGAQVFYQGSGKEHVPITITTYQYSGEKATILFDHLAVDPGNARAYVVNDNYFKDIELRAVANPATGFTNSRLHAAGCSLTFDNCSLTTDGKATQGSTYNKWTISADHYTTGGFNPLNTAFQPHYGTVTFKNGDYTGINYATAVNNDNIFQSSGSVVENPQMHCKLIIGEDAQMGTVYGTYGTMQVGSVTVEIQGGTVEEYIGTYSGSSGAVRTYATNLTTTVSGGTVNSFMGTGDYINFTGNITNNITGGTIGGSQFAAAGNNVTLTGDLENNISGGKIEVNPTDTGNSVHGIWLNGRDSFVINGNVTNNVSGGDIGVLYKVTNIKSGIWLGTRSSGKIYGNLTNNITGGNFYTKADGSSIVPSYASFHSGCFSGQISGDLVNNFVGGTFTLAKGDYYFGGQGVSHSANRVINTFGDKDTGKGPAFSNHSLHMAGGWGRIGVTVNSSTLPTTCTDTVVISNTIYGGTYPSLVRAGIASATGTNVTYIKGSIRTDIYGGSFGTFYGSSGSPVYGHVTTNIYGGTFDAIYGARNGQVYDGVELNIYGMTEGTTPTGIWAGGTTATQNVLTKYAAVLTAEEKTQLNSLLSTAEALQSKITATALQLNDAKAEVAKYDPDSVSAQDSAALLQLADEIAAIPDGNLTSAQKAEKKAAADQVAALLDAIASGSATRGDVDGDGEVNNDDVIALLWHTLFPNDYSIIGDADFTNDNVVDNDDVIALLWYTLFPNDYPL